MTSKSTGSNRRGRPAKINSDYPSGLSVTAQMDWLIENNPNVDREKLMPFVQSFSVDTPAPSPDNASAAPAKREMKTVYKMVVITVFDGLQACRIYQGKTFERILIRDVGGNWHEPTGVPEPLMKALSRSLRSKKYGAKLVATYYSLDAIPGFLTQQELPTVNIGG